MADRIPESPIEVLLIEDSESDALLVREALMQTELGAFTLTHAKSLAEGLDSLGQRYFGAVMLDLTLPDSSGVETFVKLHEGFPDVPVLILTGSNDEIWAIRALQTGAQDYRVKGKHDGRDLARALLYAVERSSFEARILDLNARLEQRVTERTAELSDAYDHMEAFSAMVSHEIKGPLSVIGGFARILADKYATQAEDTHAFNVI